MHTYKDCPFRREGIYSKDSWQKYNGCELKSDGWDYADCNTNKEYCIFKTMSYMEREKLIRNKKEKEKTW